MLCGLNKRVACNEEETQEDEYFERDHAHCGKLLSTKEDFEPNDLQDQTRWTKVKLSLRNSIDSVIDVIFWPTVNFGFDVSNYFRTTLCSGFSRLVHSRRRWLQDSADPLLLHLDYFVSFSQCAELALLIPSRLALHDDCTFEAGVDVPMQKEWTAVEVDREQCAEGSYATIAQESEYDWEEG